MELFAKKRKKKKEKVTPVDSIMLDISGASS
jgi:hypothetical protein